jgi:hypothetical protein
VSTSAVEIARPAQVERALSVEAQEDIDGLRAIKYAAALMAKSGCFADIKSSDEETAIAKAVVKIAIGRDYGFSAAESMQHIELIQGRPSIAAHGRAAKMKAAGYSWKFEQFDSSVCKLLVFDKRGEAIGDSTFTIEDAKRMGLAGKDNLVKNPRNMLYCRAISNAQRWYAPEVLSAALASKEDVQDGDYERETPDGDPRWLQRGSVEAAQEVAARKIAAIQETAAQRDARIERQIEEQAAAVRQAEGEAGKGEAGEPDGAETPTSEAGAGEAKTDRTRPVFGRPAK